LAEVNYFLATKKFTYISFYFINKLLQEEMAGNAVALDSEILIISGNQKLTLEVFLRPL